MHQATKSLSSQARDRVIQTPPELNLSSNNVMVQAVSGLAGVTSSLELVTISKRRSDEFQSRSKQEMLQQGS